MGRLTRAQQIEFDRCFFNAYSEHVTTFAKPSLSSAELKQIINRHGLIRDGKPINHKQFSAILTRHQLFSRDAWRNLVTKILYDTWSKAGMKKNTITRLLADILHLSSANVQRKIRKLGLVPKQRDVRTDYLHQQVIDQIQKGRTANEIREQFSLSLEKINYIVTVNHVPVPPEFSIHNAQMRYRDLLNITPQNAYLWGLIFSDGSISNMRGVSIPLKWTDRQLLQDIAKSLTVTEQSPKITKVDMSQAKRSGRFSSENMATIYIARKYLVDFLINNGMVRNKEHDDIRLPQVIRQAPDKIFFSFLRGFFDGDGWFAVNSRDFGLSVTRLFGEDVRDEIENRIGIRLLLRPDKSIFKLTKNGYAAVLILSTYLYRHHDICLHRKREQAISIYDQYSRIPHRATFMQVVQGEEPLFQAVISSLKQNLIPTKI